MKVAVITISDRAYNGQYGDLSGPAIEKILTENLDKIEVERVIVPDEKDKVLKSLKDYAAFDFIITTGGTGLSERDITPEVCEEYCDKAIPGIAEVLRARSYEKTPNAMLSRGYAGLKNKTIIVNFPGSVKAVTQCTHILLMIMEHATKMVNNEKH